MLVELLSAIAHTVNASLARRPDGVSSQLAAVMNGGPICRHGPDELWRMVTEENRGQGRCV